MEIDPVIKSAEQIIFNNKAWCPECDRVTTTEQIKKDGQCESCENYQENH